ncbi:hypothetical protein PHYBOEH_010228 [Phytophthora boehmeriae]|uniref:Chitin-binding type-4 domain-containing protein n=1 Tax=Phytophthora boehmeriae TaxID=109152 RepID=A0A8T1VRF0_9STRA|nr:hypothetical protein PHYBOEH_010228 [Phytophthora boehmeriae]
MTTNNLGLLISVLALSSTSVLGHGGMVKPESREIRTMGLDIESSFGWPIAMRPGGDCLNNKPDSNLQSIPYGESKIEMRANDGANHIGPCTMYLVNPDDVSDKLQVGQLDDCMRSLHPGPGSKGDPPIPAEMSIDVPKSGLPCKPEHCVLEFYWEATHLEPHELFNNCADVTLGGRASEGESGSTATTRAPTNIPSATTHAPTPATTAPPMVTEVPTATTTAPSANATYVSTGSDDSMKEAMDQWCNQNCNNNPPYCPETSCIIA